MNCVNSPIPKCILCAVLFALHVGCTLSDNDFARTAEDVSKRRGSLGEVPLQLKSAEAVSSQSHEIRIHSVFNELTLEYPSRGPTDRVVFEEVLVLPGGSAGAPDGVTKAISIVQDYAWLRSEGGITGATTWAGPVPTSEGRVSEIIRELRAQE